MSLVIVDKDLARHERRTSAIIWLCTAALAIFLIWAHFAILDEVTVGTGKVTPSSRAQVIDSLDGGIVKQLNVHEGDIVEKGQVLATSIRRASSRTSARRRPKCAPCAPRPNGWRRSCRAHR